MREDRDARKQEYIFCIPKKTSWILLCEKRNFALIYSGKCFSKNLEIFPENVKSVQQLLENNNN